MRHLALSLLLLAGPILVGQTPGRHPALDAAVSGDLEGARRLLDEDLKLVHYREPDRGSTPLEYAVRSAHLECVQLLLDRGADLQVSQKDWTILHLAARGVHPDVCIAYSSPKPSRISMAPMRQRREDVVRLLIDRGADVNRSCGGIHDRTPLADAAGHGMPRIVKLLLASGAELNPKKGAPPLYAAIAEGRLENVVLLLRAGADPSARTGSLYVDGRMSPLDFALRNGHERAARILLRNGGTVDERFERVLAGARHTRFRPMVAFLEQEAGSHGWTELKAFIAKNRPELANRLRRAGARF